MVEEVLRQFADWVALGVETAAALLIAIGAMEALVAVLRPRGMTIGRKRMVWLNFARWLVLALEFELAADIIRTSITPSWAGWAQCQITIQAPGYSHRETHLWTITGPGATNATAAGFNVK